MPAPNKTLKVNLLPKEIFDETYTGQFFQWALTYGRYIIIITQIVVLGVFFARFRLDRENVDLKESIQQKQALISSVKDVENEVRNIQERLLQIKKIESTQYVPLSVLNFLQDVTPTAIFYKHIKISSGQLSLSGSGNNLHTLSGLLFQLKKSGRFSEITLDDIQRKPDGSVIFLIGTKFLLNSFKI